MKCTVGEKEMVTEDVIANFEDATSVAIFVRSLDTNFKFNEEVEVCYEGDWSGPHIFIRKVPGTNDYKVKFQATVEPSFEDERDGKGPTVDVVEHRCSGQDIRKREAHLQPAEILIFGCDEGSSGETGR